MSDAAAAKANVDSRNFSLRLGFVPIVDYTWFTLDRAGLTGHTDQIFARLQWVY